MLGIKRYKNYSLDLWVGDKQDFYCEFKEEGSLQVLEEGLQNENQRHLSFFMKENSQGKVFFEKLKELIDKNKLPEKTRRITFLSTSVSHHDKLWEDLSEIFPA